MDAQARIAIPRNLRSRDSDVKRYRGSGLGAVPHNVRRASRPFGRAFGLGQSLAHSTPSPQLTIRDLPGPCMPFVHRVRS